MTLLTTQFPDRSGPRPQTGPVIPHEQLSQNAPPELQEELWTRMAGLEGVRVGRSLISAPQSRALHLDPALAEGPREAFILGTEFAHLHGRHDGSLHLALPRALVKDALEHGWAEPHPATRSGDWPSTLMMLYGPRDRDELELVWRLVQASYAFARGRDA